jgi:hypothetical protein
MLSSAYRRALVAASVLACVAGSPALAGSAPSARRHVDVATLPAASHGAGVVAPGSDALSPAALDSARLALAPGYSVASLRRDGTSLRATLVYVADGARDGVAVERSGTVNGDRVSFAPGAVLAGSVSTTAAGTYRVTNAPGVAGIAAVPPCVPICLTPATLTPKHQVVNGQGYGPGVYQVSLYLTGSATIPAARDITVPFATCSASQCQRITYVPSQAGTSYHTFAPLGCDQSRTVWGTIMYNTGWVNDSATVQIDNPGC